MGVGFREFLILAFVFALYLVVALLWLSTRILLHEIKQLRVQPWISNTQLFKRSSQLLLQLVLDLVSLVQAIFASPYLHNRLERWDKHHIV